MIVCYIQYITFVIASRRIDYKEHKEHILPSAMTAHGFTAFESYQLL